ncbi:MAG: competence protein CoiA [Pseudomonadales bacterium]
MSQAEWEALKTSDRRALLKMPCCGGRAIAKTSSLGTRYFSHYRKSEDCDFKPESKEHLLLKEIVATAASASGWQVVTEGIGETKDGQKWRADVLCKKNNALVALEVQLSNQTLEEFKARQDRYKKSAVRAAWFVSEIQYSHTKSLLSKDIPIFYVGWESGYANPQALDFAMPLADFVKALLSGMVTWKDEPEEYEVLFLKDTCWKCGSTVNLPYGYSVGVYGDNIKTIPNCDKILSEIRKTVGNEFLRENGINTIHSHPRLKGNAPNFPNCCVCVHCGTPEANSYLYEKHIANYKLGSANRGSVTKVIGRCEGRWEIEL